MNIFWLISSNEALCCNDLKPWFFLFKPGTLLNVLFHTMKLWQVHDLMPYVISKPGKHIRKLFHAIKVCANPWSGFKPHRFGTFILSNHIEFHHNYLKPQTWLELMVNCKPSKSAHSWFANHENLHIYGMRTIICAVGCFYFWPVWRELMNDAANEVDFGQEWRTLLRICDSV
jgi:hypothetical protein